MLGGPSEILCFSFSLVLPSVIAGSQAFLSVPEHDRDMISNLVLMLVPSANTFGIGMCLPLAFPASFNCVVI